MKWMSSLIRVNLNDNENENEKVIKRVIFLERKQFKELREFFGIDRSTAWRALRFLINSERAKRIRTYAMNNLKGKYYEYEETNGNSGGS